jgi:hypothetical protein
MTTPERNPDYGSPIWLPPSACDHPREKLNFTGHFPPENPELSVFNAHCLKCGASWDQSDKTAPWDQLMLKIANGEFGAIHPDEPEIMDGVEWQRQNRYDQIMRDVAGEANPITGSNVRLQRPD